MWQTTVQTHVPPERLNRVTSYEVFGSNGSLPIGQALAGPVAGVVSAERVLAASVAVSVLGCTTLLAVPAVRNLRRTRDPPPPPTTKRPPGLTSKVDKLSEPVKGSGGAGESFAVLRRWAHASRPE